MGHMGSLPNMGKKGFSFECSLGKKLYAVKAKSYPLIAFKRF